MVWGTVAFQADPLVGEGEVDEIAPDVELGDRGESRPDRPSGMSGRSANHPPDEPHPTTPTLAYAKVRDLRQGQRGLESISVERF